MNFSHKSEVDNEDTEAVRETLKADRACVIMNNKAHHSHDQSRWVDAEH